VVFSRVETEGILGLDKGDNSARGDNFIIWVTVWMEIWILLSSEFLISKVKMIPRLIWSGKKWLIGFLNTITKFFLDKVSILTKKNQNNNKGANPTHLGKANKTPPNLKQKTRKLGHTLERG
jgi:hypothetical protein